MQLLHGDCLELMKTIPDKSIDMVLSDIPYGTTACKWDVVIPFEPMWEQLKRVTKDNGAICLFGSQPFTSVLVCSNLKMFKYDVYWKKEKPNNIFQVKRRFGKSTEVISIFYKEQPTYNPQMVKHTGKLVTNKPKGIHKSIVMGNSRQKVAAYIDNGFRYPTDVLEFRREILGSTVHPTQKPVALLEYLIKTYTNEGETVLDFTAGSFSTGVACVNIGRNFIGIEKDERYFNIGVNRVKERISCLGLEIEPMIDMVDY